MSVGGRPNVPDSIKGAKEHAITSDDVFWMTKAPGKTCIAGGSYIALETAGFLAGMGFDVTVIVRSILLRGFDEDIGKKIGVYMAEKCNVNFQYDTVIEEITKTESGSKRVTLKNSKTVSIQVSLLSQNSIGCYQH